MKAKDRYTVYVFAFLVLVGTFCLQDKADVDVILISTSTTSLTTTSTTIEFVPMTVTTTTLLGKVWRSPIGVISGAELYTINETVDTQLGTSDFYHYIGKISNVYFEYSAYYKDKSSGTRTHPVAILKSDYVVTQSPQNMDLEGTNIGKKLTDSAVYEDAKVTYLEQWGSGIDLVYTYGRQYLKEEVVIDDISDLPSGSPGDMLNIPFKMRVYNILDGDDGGLNLSVDKVNLADDAIISNTNGILQVNALNGSSIFTMGRPIVTDAVGHSILLNYSIDVTRFGNFKVTTHVPWDWLSHANITFPVSVDPTWINPSSAITLTTEGGNGPSGGNDVEESLDDNIWTFFCEDYTAGDNEIGSYEWGARYDLGSTYVVSEVKVHMGLDGGPYHNPLRVAVIKVCDDSACSGESNLLSGAEDFQEWVWHTMDPADGTGRWLEIQGGLCSSASGSNCVAWANKVSGGAEMCRFNEIEAYTETTTTTTTTLCGNCQDGENWEIDRSITCKIEGECRPENITFTGEGDIMFSNANITFKSIVGGVNLSWEPPFIWALEV